MNIVLIANQEQAGRVSELISELCIDHDNKVIEVVTDIDVVYVLSDDIDVKRQ